jgi:hypothetical protein
LATKRASGSGLAWKQLVDRHAGTRMRAGLRL